MKGCFTVYQLPTPLQSSYICLQHSDTTILHIGMEWRTSRSFSFSVFFFLCITFSTVLLLLTDYFVKLGSAQK